jgi:hypothetical protein
MRHVWLYVRVQLANHWMQCDAILFSKILLNDIGILQFLFESDKNNGYLLRTPLAVIANYLSHWKYFPKTL